MELDKKTQRRIRNWMTLNAADYTNSTSLAEDCADILDVWDDDREHTIPEDVYEVAMEFIDEDGLPTTLADRARHLRIR